jgi:hypothetical protein
VSKRGLKVVAYPSPGRPQDRAAHLGAMAIAQSAPFAEGVEQAIRDQQASKHGARAISGANQRARAEVKSQAARDRRDNRGRAPVKAISQFLIPID